jgi:hypothetical protein
MMSGDLFLIVADADRVNRDMLRAWLALVISMAALGQVVPEASVETEDRPAGPFAVGDRSFQLVLTVAKLAGAETVSSVQVKDADGTVCFERKLPYEIDGGRFEETTSVEAKPLSGKSGSGLLLTYRVNPSGSRRGRSWQVLGVVGGKLVPFSPPVTPEGELLGQPPDSPMNTSRDEALQVDVLNFRIWTGNFFAIVPLEVNWDQGYMRPAYRLVEKCRMLVEGQRKPAESEASVALFPESDQKLGAPAQVVVRKNSTVELLWAEGRILWEESEDRVYLSAFEDIWLKVRIDGKEGYLHSPEDFAAIGLPEAE